MIVCMVLFTARRVSFPFPFPSLFAARVAPATDGVVVSAAGGWQGAKVPEGFVAIVFRVEIFLVARGLRCGALRLSCVVLRHLRVRVFQSARGLRCGARRLGCVVLGPSGIRIVQSARGLRCGALRLSRVALRHASVRVFQSARGLCCGALRLSCGALGPFVF